MPPKKKNKKKEESIPNVITEQSKFIQELATTKQQHQSDTEAPKEHYVDNKQMLADIVTYKERLSAASASDKPKPKIPDSIGKQLMLIAENLSHKPNFNNYTFKAEMISDGIENCIMYFDNFDPVRSKYPFTYFTKIIYYAFVRRIQKEKKQLYIKYKIAQQSGSLNLQELQESEEINPGANSELYDNISEFIGKYELAQEESKKKSILKKAKVNLELLMDEGGDS